MVSPNLLPEFRLTMVTTSPFEPRRRSRAFEEDDALRRVREHLEANLDRRVLLSEAAAVAGFERTYFSAYFREKVGITFVRWMNAVRVTKAIEILRTEPRSTISDVAARVGYTDLRTFERNFVKLTGQNPSSWRVRLAPEEPTTGS